MTNLKNLGQELTREQQQQVLGGARQLCFSCKVAGHRPPLDSDLPPCSDCNGY